MSTCTRCALHDLQLSERRRGNECYRRGQMDQAMYHYERAKSIVDIVAGMGKAEQEEIDSNKVSVLLNIAGTSGIFLQVLFTDFTGYFGVPGLARHLLLRLY